MRAKQSILCCCLAILPGGCGAQEGGSLEEGEIHADSRLGPQGSASAAGPKATGDVEVEFKGGKGEGSSAERRAVADFDVHAAYSGRPARGEFRFRVFDPELSYLHREIVAKVDWVEVDGDHAMFQGLVVYDSKTCSDPGSGHGEEGGCGGDHTDEGGCSGEDDGGCSGHEPGDDTHEEGSCGGSGHGGPAASGRNCRIGQYVFGKVRDVSTPGALGDVIHWKWLTTPAIESLSSLAESPRPCLCKKEIVGGNLVVHSTSSTDVLAE